MGHLLPSPCTQRASHLGSEAALGALDHPSTALGRQTHPTQDRASHRDVLYLTPGREIGSSALDPRTRLDDASTLCFPQAGSWNPRQHLLPGEETTPESPEVHVRVGHDPSVEVDKVQALKPAWRRAEESGLEGGQGCPAGWSAGREVSDGVEIPYLQRSSRAARRMEARLPRSTSTVETWAEGWVARMRSRVASLFCTSRQAMQRWMRPSSSSSRWHSANPTPLQRDGVRESPAQASPLPPPPRPRCPAVSGSVGPAPALTR